MQVKRNRPVLSALLMLFVIQACQAQTKSSRTTADTQLMCYVCENCAQITAQTPLLPCNEEFFTGATTTTTVSTITTDPASSTTIEVVTMPSTEAAVSTTIETTEPAPPKPPTIGPPLTTTPVPTPPNPGTVIVALDQDGEKVEAENENMRTPPILTTTPNTDTTSTSTTTTTTNSPTTEVLALNHTDVLIMNTTSNGSELPSDGSETTTTSHLHIRQRRQAINTDVTYHCYRILKSQNGTSVTQRGCSRVTTMEAVCTQLKEMNAAANSSVSKCFPCSNSRCNGSSSLGVSIVTMFMALVAVLLYHK